MQKVKQRQEIDTAYQWKLEKMYPTLEAWEQDFQLATQQIEEIATQPGNLKQSAAGLLQGLQLMEKLDRTVEKLFVFARMRRDENNQNPQYQALAERVQALMVQAGSAEAFMIPEILEIEADTLQKWMQEREELSIYQHFFASLLHQKEHILSAKEERLLAMSGELGASPQQIFTMLNNADIKFPSVLNEQGEEVEITHARYGTLMESHNREVRRNTFQKMYSSYEKLLNTLGSTYASSVKKDIFYARARNYPSSLAAALDGDHIETDVYEQLIASVHAKMPYMYRYLDLKKRMLQLKELHMYDVYTPLIDHINIQIPYEQAKEIVAQALLPLGKDYIEVLQTGANSGWIDVYENEGKTSGAYSWGCYDSQPYVLMNYENHLEDVFTLAHELGHSMHSYYSNHAQPYLYSQYPIFLAEVASTVNESLLSDYLLKNSRSREEKLYILNHYLEQFKATVYRQTMFAEFEKIIHEYAEQGEGITPQLCNQIYLDLNRLYFGEDMVLDAEIRMEWARIPHFYTAFYVYKYATGFSAATLLKQQILTEGQSAAARYRRFLQSGSSEYPIQTLQLAGVDLLTPEPVEKSLDYFNQLMDEMDALLRE